MFLGLKAFSRNFFILLVLFFSMTESARARQQIPFGFLSPSRISSCAGIPLGGYCWYWGGAGQSCDTGCASHGGCDPSGIETYTGSSGTDANCLAVIQALGATTVASVYAAASGQAGCMQGVLKIKYFLWIFVYPDNLRSVTSPTTCSSAALNSDHNRVCSCRQ